MGRYVDVPLVEPGRDLMVDVDSNLSRRLRRRPSKIACIVIPARSKLPTGSPWPTWGKNGPADRFPAVRHLVNGNDLDEGNSARGVSSGYRQ